MQLSHLHTLCPLLTPGPFWEVVTAVGTSQSWPEGAEKSWLLPVKCWPPLGHTDRSPQTTPLSSPGSQQQRRVLSDSYIHSVVPALCPVLKREPRLITATVYCIRVSFRENVCLLWRRLENSVTRNMITYCPPACSLQMFKMSILYRYAF